MAATINSTEKCMKNYLYDNPELRDVEAKKACTELEDDFDSDTEVWIFQCPKDFDPQNLMNIELSKSGKQSKMECSADRFGDGKTLSVISPVTEYDLISDSMKVVKPVGKIIVKETLGESQEANTSRSAKRLLNFGFLVNASGITWFIHFY